MQDTMTKTQVLDSKFSTFKHPDHLFLGRIEVEIIKEDVLTYKRELYGLSKDSSLVLPDMDTGHVPYRLGKILKMAPDAFGERFKRCYGSDFIRPELGDTLMFVPNQSYRLDHAGNYHIIGDEHIIAFYKGSIDI